MQHRNNFDLIRLFAASQVMLSHSIEWLHLQSHFPIWTPRLIGLFPGVAIFFVISGYLITGSYAYSSKGLGEYAISRILRIYPGLWFNLAGILIALTITGQLAYDISIMRLPAWTAAASVLASDYLANIVVGPIFREGFYPSFPSGVLWTLPIELSFYALVPLIFIGRAAWDRRLSLVSIIGWGAVSFAIFTQWNATGYPYLIAKYLWIFLLGALIRVLIDRARWMFEGKGWLWLPLYITVGLWISRRTGAGYDYGIFGLQSTTMTILLAITVISCAFTLSGTAKTLLRGIDLSYGVYLWHMPVIYTFMGFGLTGEIGFAVAAWVIAIGIAACSWLLVERNALDLKRSILQRVAKEPEAPAAAAAE